MDDERTRSSGTGGRRGAGDAEPGRRPDSGPSDGGGGGPEASGDAGAGRGDAGDGPGDGGPAGGRGASRAGGRGGRADRTWGETLHGVQEAVGDMVGEVLDGVRDVTAGRRFPRVDVIRLEGEGYRVFVDLPGVQKEELEVTTMGGEITVAGRRLPNEIPDDADVLRSERGHGSFRRSVRLPADARGDEVRATLEDGVLVIRVPVAEPGDARTVEID